MSSAAVRSHDSPQLLAVTSSRVLFSLKVVSLVRCYMYAGMADQRHWCVLDMKPLCVHKQDNDVNRLPGGCVTLFSMTEIKTVKLYLH